MSETSEREYLSVTDTAKLVRTALRAEWPGVKFSVRSSKYAGGASIDVSWVDGPTVGQVDAITNLYRGADFDGMTDSKSYRDAVALIGGELRSVHYGADFIPSHRDRSPAEIERLEILARLNWHNGISHGNGEQCGRCYLHLPEGRVWYSPAAERFMCSPTCWALAQHWATDYTA